LAAAAALASASAAFILATLAALLGDNVSLSFGGIYSPLIFYIHPLKSMATILFNMRNRERV